MSTSTHTFPSVTYSLPYHPSHVPPYPYPHHPPSVAYNLQRVDLLSSYNHENRGQNIINRIDTGESQGQIQGHPMQVVEGNMKTGNNPPRPLVEGIYHIQNNHILKGKANT